MQRSNFRRGAVWLAVVCATLIAPARARAQQSASSATVTGTVYDPTDAVVARAAVSLRNHNTNQVVATTTDGSGRFRLLYVPVGDYHLSVVATGFVTTNVNLTLTVGEVLDVPVKLTGAAASEVVSVVQDAPVLDTARTHVSETITPREVDALPLN